MTTAFIFPGQGSQFIGMGKELYESFSVAREVFDEVDDALDQGISTLMFDGAIEELTQTANAQPALMAVSLASLRVLEKEGGWLLPDGASYVAGHSLGEYAALAAAGMFSLADTARLLRIRGQAMQTAVPAGEGAMAAVLGLEMAQVLEIAGQAANKKSKGQICVVANDNCQGQIVISGSKGAVNQAIELAAAKGAVRSVLLPVSAPFHCPLMAPAAVCMREALSNVPAKRPRVPIVSNVTAHPETDPDHIITLLVEQITHRVRWRESVAMMAQAGVDTFVEVGAGAVLTGLVKRIAPDAQRFTVGSPKGVEAFLKTK